MAHMIVLGREILLQQVCLRVWGNERKPVSERLSMSSVTGEVFCLVTAGKALGQSHHFAGFE